MNSLRVSQMIQPFICGILTQKHLRCCCWGLAGWRTVYCAEFSSAERISTMLLPLLMILLTSPSSPSNLAFLGVCICVLMKIWIVMRLEFLPIIYCSTHKTYIWIDMQSFHIPLLSSAVPVSWSIPMLPIPSIIVALTRALSLVSSSSISVISVPTHEY